MWALKILTGSQIGKVVQLKEGTQVLGRSPESDIILASHNVSKKHAAITVQGSVVVLEDLQSTNGCFVNETKVIKSKIHVGDKISFHDIVVEIIQDHLSSSMAPFQGSGELDLNGESNLSLHIDEDHIVQPYDPPVEVFKKKTDAYFEKNVLPGIYKLTEVMDFQWVIGFFFILIVVISTSLSIIPLVRTLKSNVEEASFRDVKNIVGELVNTNRGLLFKKLFSAIEMESIYKKEGVAEAFITDLRGEVIIPSHSAGKTLKIKKFHIARRLEKDPFLEFISDREILAVKPFKYFDPKKSIETVRYYGVVVYKIDTLAMSFNHTLSMFIQTLSLSILAALILYFFVSRLISYPLRVLNRQLDIYLRNSDAEIKTSLKFPILQKVYSNLNSALNRVHSSSKETENHEYDRTLEMQNIVELIGFPALSIRASDETIAAFNPGFEEKTGLIDIQEQSILKITDQSLRLCLEDLLERIKSTPDEVVTNELEFSGDPYEVAIQAIHGSKDIAYYIVSLIPTEVEG